MAKEMEIEELQRIAKKLKQLRLNKGYKSYETFAVDHELDRKQYWRIENGSNITLATLIKVLKIHRISLKRFFSDFS
jgi:transcriptional regulator with XRE-family HTH domain